jgi:hypothetical protein
LVLELEAGVATLHEREHAVGAGLHRQVQVVGELRHARERFDQAVVELERMRGGEATPLDAAHPRDVVDERVARSTCTVGHRTAVRVDVLAEERHRRRPGAASAHSSSTDSKPRLTSPRGKTMRAAVLAAAFHHRHVGARGLGGAVLAGDRTSRSGKLTSTTARPPCAQPAIMSRRQA